MKAMRVVFLMFMACLGCACNGSAAVAQQVRKVMRPSVDVAPHGRAALSTAQAAHMVKHLPLKVLPAFTTTGLDGKPVTADSAARPEHWLLLYTRNGCELCQKLMVALGNSSSPSLRRGAPYVIVVAHSSGFGTLDATRARYPMLADATWLEDASGSAVQALKPSGTPVLYAMHGKDIAWKIPGALDHTASVEKLARAWMESKDTPTVATSSPAEAATAAPGKATRDQ